jgi:L-alanine-DL-glutamate epimerase-like enolase superfamily enzyme
LRFAKPAIDACASDYVMLDVMKIGGVSGWLRAQRWRRPADYQFQAIFGLR